MSDINWKHRYKTAYEKYQDKISPNVVRDFGYLLPKYPDIKTSNGLTRFIIDFLKFEGCYGNRINTVGRKIFDKKKGKDIWIKGSTKVGTGDIVSCINGKMVYFEVKIGYDKPSDKQLEQQNIVRNSGGEYEFIKTPEDFLLIYDKTLNNGNVEATKGL